jgi:hypothetical protein
MKLHFHKLQYLKQTETSKFLGEPYSWEWKRFRVCLKCGKIQEIRSHSQGSDWNTLGSGQMDIVIKKYGITFKEKTK